MAIRIINLLTIIILIANTIFGQNYEPVDLAKKIFSKDSFPDFDNYITGEYKGEPNGKNLQNGLTTKFLSLEQTENTAVVAMTLLDPLGKGVDSYLYFQKDSIWKMSAFRSLAMTEIIHRAKYELEKMTPKEVNSIIAKSKKKKKKNTAETFMFSSKEDYNFQLGNMKLILELDENIIKHFIANQAEFERLKNRAVAQLDKQKEDDESNKTLIEDLKSDYQKVFIYSVSAGDYELGNNINFLIGGIGDNVVGYIYVKDKNDLPKMNSSGIIMLREIGNGWYIYKTT